MKKNLKPHRILVALLTILVIYIGIRYSGFLTKNANIPRNGGTSSIVLSLEDNFKKNDYWSASFNLLWNALTYEMDSENIKNSSSKNKKLIDNLNKKTFTKTNLKSDAYYNKYGYATEELKNAIAKDLKKKFNMNSEILDNVNWNGEKYYMYSALYKNLKFKYKFQNLDKEMFKNKDGVAYFGLKKNGNKKIREQIRVLYYKDINNFAIKLITASDDEVILSRGAKGNNFLEVYQNIQKNTESYDGSLVFSKNDELKVPVISFHYYEEIDDLNGVGLPLTKEDEKIGKIIRDTSFKLDARGDKLMDKDAIAMQEELLDKDMRLFYLTSDFSLFLIEKNKDLPYFALNVTDIGKFQSDL